MPKWTQSKTMDKFVSTFCRITKKDNPKEVYALFMNNPDVNYESTVDGLMPDSEVRKVHESLVDVLTRPGNEVLPDRIDLEKSAEAAKAIKPEEKVEEVSKVSEAVMKRAEESAAKAALSNEEAEKRAAAAAAARERVQAKIEAAKLKAEQQAEIARAEAKTASLASASKKDEGDSLISKNSIEDIMAQKEAEKKAAKAVAPAPATAPVQKPAEVTVDDIPEIKPEQIAPAPVAPAPAPAPADDGAGKPLWERAGGEEISEEEIFGEDKF